MNVFTTPRATVRTCHTGDRDALISILCDAEARALSGDNYDERSVDKILNRSPHIGITDLCVVDWAFKKTIGYLQVSLATNRWQQEFIHKFNKSTDTTRMVGMSLHKSVWDQGIGTEVYYGLFAYLKLQGVQTLVTGCQVHNTRSFHVLKNKLCFTPLDEGSDDRYQTFYKDL